VPAKPESIRGPPPFRTLSMSRKWWPISLVLLILANVLISGAIWPSSPLAVRNCLPRIIIRKDVLVQSIGLKTDHEMGAMEKCEIAVIGA
jgi:hypothetical protein